MKCSQADRMSYTFEKTQRKIQTDWVHCTQNFRFKIRDTHLRCVFWFSISSWGIIHIHIPESGVRLSVCAREWFIFKWAGWRVRRFICWGKRKNVVSVEAVSVHSSIRAFVPPAYIQSMTHVWATHPPAGVLFNRNSLVFLSLVD